MTKFDEGEQDIVENTHIGDLEVDEISDDISVESLNDSLQGFHGHKDSIYCLCCCTTADYLIASGGGDDMAYVWSSVNGACVAKCCGHTDSVVAICFSYNSNYLATGSMDNTVRIWKCHIPKWLEVAMSDIDSQADNIITDEVNCILTLEASSEIVWLQWHPVGNLILAGVADGSGWLWSVPSGQIFNVFHAHSLSNNSGCFFPPSSGKSIITVSQDGTACVFDPRVVEPKFRVNLIIRKMNLEDDIEGLNYVTTDSEGNIATIGGTLGILKILNLKSGNVVASLNEQTGHIECISWCSVQPFIACASVDGSIAIYDSRTWKFRLKVNHNDAAIFVKFIKNSAELISASIDQTIRKWDARSGECLKIWNGNQDAILCCLVTSNKVISAGDDAIALVFEND